MDLSIIIGECFLSENRTYSRFVRQEEFNPIVESIILTLTGVKLKELELVLDANIMLSFW